jgi:hypothetical protein
VLFRDKRPDAGEIRSIVTIGARRALFTIRKGLRPGITVELLDGAGGYAVDSRVHAYVIMRSPNVFLKLTQTPVMPKRELLSSIRYTERDSTAFNLDTALADSWIMDGANGSSKMNSLIAVLPEESVKERLDNAIPGFGGPKSVTVVPAALRALVTHAASLRVPAPSLFIHVCDDGFGAYAFSGGKIVFMREAPMPRAPGESGFHKTLAEEIARSADFLSRTSGISFDAVWLLGPGAQDGLSELLSSELGVDVKLYDPSRDFSISFAGSPSLPGGYLAVMLGAALDGGETIKITPRKLVTPRFYKKPVPAAVMVTAVAVFCAGLASSFAFKTMDERIVTLKAEIAGLKKTTSSHEKAAEALARLQAENAALKSRIEAFQRVIAEPRPSLRNALTLLAANSPDNVALTRLEVNIIKVDRQDAASPPASGPSRRNTRIEGLARGTEAEMTAGVSALLSALSGSPLFSYVTLRRLRKEPPGSASAGMTSFEIVADLIPSQRDGWN